LFGNRIEPKKEKKGIPDWKIFKKDGFLFLDTYSKKNTLRVFPKELEEICKEQRVGQTTYKGSHTKYGNISTFLLDVRPQIILNTAKKYRKEVAFVDLDKDNTHHPETIDTEYNIIMRHTLKGKKEKAFLHIIREDVLKFVKDKKTKMPQDIQSHIIRVPNIDHIPTYNLINPNSFLVRRGKGIFNDICKLMVGINPFSRYCLSGLTADAMYDPSGRCTYCYAGHQNGSCATENIFDFTEQELLNLIDKEFLNIQKASKDNNFLENKILSIRLGQNSESYMPKALREIIGLRPEHDNFVKTLKAIKELNAKYKTDHKSQIATIIPSKSLEFDDRYVQLFKDANASILMSIFDSRLERGMINHGATTEKRINTALEYAKAGVNSGIYLAVDITRGPEGWNNDVQIAFDFYTQHSNIINLQLLDKRGTLVKDDIPIFGTSRYDIITPKNSIKNSGLIKPKNKTTQIYKQRFKRNIQNYLVPVKTHPFYLKLLRRSPLDIRMCSTHVSEGHQKCGGCFYEKPFIGELHKYI
jgi:hypothetical protein